MRILLSSRALRDYERLPEELRIAVDKQFNFLLTNISYPSLHAKKYDESRDVWQARVDSSCRFYFQIKGDVYVIVSITKHPK